MKNERRGNDISERLLNFAADILKLVTRLNKTAVGRHIGGQLTRSGTSAGANYEEACGAESRADFIHKMQLVLKELKGIPILAAADRKGKPVIRSESKS